MDVLAWRERMGWTQEQAAEALGVSRPTYQRLERGQSWQTGEVIELDRRTVLACMALEAGIRI